MDNLKPGFLLSSGQEGVFYLPIIISSSTHTERARLVTHSAIEGPCSLAPWLVELLFFQISQQSLIYGYWFQFGGKSSDP